MYSNESSEQRVDMNAVSLHLNLSPSGAHCIGGQHQQYIKGNQIGCKERVIVVGGGRIEGKKFGVGHP